MIQNGGIIVLTYLFPFAIQSIMEAVENGDLELFTNQVADFDKMTRLDSWKTTLLLRIKKEIQEEEPSMT